MGVMLVRNTYFMMMKNTMWYLIPLLSCCGSMETCDSIVGAWRIEGRVEPSVGYTSSEGNGLILLSSNSSLENLDSSDVVEFTDSGILKSLKFDFVVSYRIERDSILLLKSDWQHIVVSDDIAVDGIIESCTIEWLDCDTILLLHQRGGELVPWFYLSRISK